MADQEGTIVNPSGNDSHSVESAAQDFTAMLTEEGRHDRRQARREDGKFASQSPEGSDDAGEGESGEPKRQPRKRERERPAEDQGDDAEADPILDGAPEGKPEDKGEGDDDGAEDEDQGEDDDTEDDDEEEDGDDDPLDAEHEITVNGEKLKVSVREALAGYMKDSDYRQGTERNAREYEEIQEFAKGTVETRQRTDTALNEALALIEALQPSKEDWDAMEQNNPQAYIAAQKHWAGLLDKAKGILATKNQLSSDQQAETVQQRRNYLRLQDQKLVEKFPALRDEKTANSFRQNIMEYGRKAGYSDEELINGAVDHRDLITLYKAAQFDKIRDSKAAAGRRAGQKAPKPSAETRANSRNSGRSANRTALREADRRLQRTGSVQDAAAAFAELVRD